LEMPPPTWGKATSLADQSQLRPRPALFPGYFSPEPLVGGVGLSPPPGGGASPPAARYPLSGGQHHHSSQPLTLAPPSRVVNTFSGAYCPLKALQGIHRPRISPLQPGSRILTRPSSTPSGSAWGQFAPGPPLGRRLPQAMLPTAVPAYPTVYPPRPEAAPTAPAAHRGRRRMADRMRRLLEGGQAHGGKIPIHPSLPRRHGRPLLRYHGHRMQVVDLTTGVVLARRLACACTWWRRLVGLLGRRCLDPDEGLLIAPCSAVHTFFMRFPLDVAGASSEGV